MAGSNEHLVERFRRGKLPHPQNSTFLGIDPRASTQAKLNTSIRHYVNTKTQIPGKWEFIHKREIPTQDEISVLEDGEVLEVPGNTVVGPWTSKLRYLNNHYELLREDAITPLRNVVSEMKAEPHFTEKDSIESSYIYEKVHFLFCLVTFFVFTLTGLHHLTHLYTPWHSCPSRILSQTMWKEDQVGTVKAFASGDSCCTYSNT